MRKICVVITARASYSRIKAALMAMKENPAIDLSLVVTSSGLLPKYGMVYKQIQEDGLVIADKIYTVVEGENGITASKTVGISLLELSSVFARIEPDVVITIADRYETIATAICAAYMNIPLIHIQGGEVTGNIDEKVRHAVTKLSDLHFVSSQAAADRILKMGEAPQSVYVTGCPSIDLARKVLEKPTLDFDPIEKYGGSGLAKIAPKDYYIVIQHPVTDESNEAFAQVTETLYAMVEQGNPVYWIWPNADAGSDGVSKGIRTFREKVSPSNIWFFRDIPSRDFLKLLHNARAIVGNSSVAIRECSYLGVPAVNIGSRQAGRDRGCNVVDVSPNREDILSAIYQQSNTQRIRSELYGDGYAGEKIAHLAATVPLHTSKKITY